MNISASFGLKQSAIMRYLRSRKNFARDCSQIFPEVPFGFLAEMSTEIPKERHLFKELFQIFLRQLLKKFFKGFTRNSSRDLFENCTTTLLVQPELNLRIAQGILPGTAPNILPKTLSDTPAESPLKFPPGIFQETLLEIPPRSRYSKDFTRN